MTVIAKVWFYKQNDKQKLRITSDMIGCAGSPKREKNSPYVKVRFPYVRKCLRLVGANGK